jgi:hypothetical protein
MMGWRIPFPRPEHDVKLFKRFHSVTVAQQTFNLAGQGSNPCGTMRDRLKAGHKILDLVI